MSTADGGNRAWETYYDGKRGNRDVKKNIRNRVGRKGKTREFCIGSLSRTHAFPFQAFAGTKTFSL